SRRRMAGPDAATAIAPADGRGNPLRRPLENRQRCAPAASDRPAPWRCATRPAAQQRLRTIAEKLCAEVSWCPPSAVCSRRLAAGPMLCEKLAAIFLLRLGGLFHLHVLR